MKHSKGIAEETVKNFLSGYNCAQSVLLTIAKRYKVRSALIPKIATGFGSGIGRCGSVCGALTGGVMAIGMRCGTNKPSRRERERCYELTEKLFARFKDRHGTILCRDLIGYNLSEAEERRRATDENVFEKKCPDFVRTVIVTLMDLGAAGNKPVSKQKRRA